jgi:hypothetical protein
MEPMKFAAEPMMSDFAAGDLVRRKVAIYSSP